MAGNTPAKFHKLTKVIAALGLNVTTVINPL